jgi:hypothetical protein
MKKLGFVRGLLKTALVLLFAGATVLPSTGAGTPPKEKTPPADSIDVVGHLDLPGASVAGLTASRHWRREYLHLQDTARGVLTVVDVTDPAHPSIVRQIHLPAEMAKSRLAVSVGDAALLTETSTPPAAARPGSVSIVSFADPDHPRTLRKFDHVTAFWIHRERGLIYLANSEGLWILRQNPAPDQELERAYANYVLYYH